MIPCQRHLFDIPDDVAYLNCAYMSPLMHSVREAGRAGLDRKVRPWTLSSEEFFSESEQVRALFAGLIGARADDIAIVPSASYGIAVAARNLPVEAGGRLVILAEQFPSNVYAWRALAAERGAALVTVARPDDGDWTGAVLAAIDERTCVAALPHSHWIDGALVDLAAVGARCREVGAALVVDATQSLGALAFDVSAVKPDFLVAATYKWLLGPYSLGFLYAAPAHQAGRPLEHNWIVREGAEDFAGLIDYRDAFQPGARRYDMGERSNFVLLPMAAAALRQLHDWGVGEIASSLRALTRRIAQRTAALGAQTLPEERRAGHYLGLRFAGGMPANLTDALAREQVYVSVRGDSMRVTPHLYNSEADIDRLVSVLERTA